MANYALVNSADEIVGFRDTAPTIIIDGSPRVLPIVRNDVDFNPVTEVREGPTYTVEPTQVTETFTKRPKTTAEIDRMRATKVADVHSTGNTKLAALVSNTQQIQALTVLVQLLYSHTDLTAWPPGERVLAAGLRTRLANIATVRDAEDAKVSEVQALTTPEQIAAYDETAGWPS